MASNFSVKMRDGEVDRLARKDLVVRVREITFALAQLECNRVVSDHLLLKIRH